MRELCERLLKNNSEARDPKRRGKGVTKDQDCSRIRLGRSLGLPIRQLSQLIEEDAESRL